MKTSMSVLSMGSILRTAQGGIKPLGMGGVLSSGYRKAQTSRDYAAMADAAGELARMSTGERSRYNKALQEYYRALSVRDSVAPEKREVEQRTEQV